MEKKPFVTREQLEEIKKTYPTPFHLYDEKGIRENGERLMRAFSWNKGFREYFAVKATPNPFVIDILKKLGCGVDCSSLTELMMAKAMKYDGEKIMFSSNDTPPEEFKMAAELGAIINLDDFTHIDFLEKTIGYIPETISCRYNPGGLFKISNDIMDNPGDAKYGMTTEQLFEAFKVLKAKGAKHFGIHAFLASNTVTNEYYPMLAKVLFEVAVKLKEETGADIKFINLSGGVGIPYRPDQEPNDIFAIGEGVHLLPQLSAVFLIDVRRELSLLHPGEVCDPPQVIQHDLREITFPDVVRAAGSFSFLAVGVALEIVLQLFHGRGTMQHHWLSAICTEYQTGEEIWFVHLFCGPLFMLAHLLHDLPLLL